MKIPKHMAAELLRFDEEETDFDEQLNRLIGWCDAYPEDVFTPLEGFKIPIKDSIGDYDTLEKRNLITRASAHMGRHMIAKALKPAILHLRELVDLVADREKRIAELGFRAVRRKAEVERLTATLKDMRDTAACGQDDEWVIDAVDEALAATEQGEIDE